MTEELFNALLEEIFEQERAIGKTKGIEYIHQNSYDRLDNFKRIGALFKLDPKVVLGVYLRKHLDAIMNYISTGEAKSEDILGRLLDARVYLSLLWGLIVEDRKVV
jgi:hypothetical protein